MAEIDRRMSNVEAACRRHERFIESSFDWQYLERGAKIAHAMRATNGMEERVARIEAKLGLYTPLPPRPEPTDADRAYTERNHLVAYLSRIFPSWAVEPPPMNPWWIVYVSTPEGQMSWHVHFSEMTQFRHLEGFAPSEQWDGHSTEEKYDRLQRLGKPRVEITEEDIQRAMFVVFEKPMAGTVARRSIRGSIRQSFKAMLEDFVERKCR